MDEETNLARDAVVYESMFGNTRVIAFEIAEALRERGVPALVVPVTELARLPQAVDTIIIGAPTHVHGLSRGQTRAEAARWAADPARKLQLEDGMADSGGVRDWVEHAPPVSFAAFDTRLEIPRLFGGSAATSIDRKMRARGGHRIAEPESFFVDNETHLKKGELERAHDWGRRLADELLPARSSAR